MKTVALSIDVEQDCPPFLDTMNGIEQGLPRLLDLVREQNIKATFFTTGHVARSFPGTIAAIPDGGHELACHGYSHRRFDTLTLVEAERELDSARAILDGFGTHVHSFRAPNLRLPEGYLGLLKKHGFDIDSSIAAYKPPYKKNVYKVDGIVRIPATLTSSVLRLPLRLALAVITLFDDLVLFAHPWEFIDMSGTGIRYDCRFNTGAKALVNLNAIIERLRLDGYRFLTIEERALRCD